MDTNEEYLFNNDFNNINLNDELKSFYAFLNDEELNESVNKENKLTELRNQNYKRFGDINLTILENLSEEFEDITREIKKIYGFIDSNELLVATIEEAHNNKKIIDLIYNYINQLNIMIENELKDLEKENNERQDKIKHINYKNVDTKALQQILNKYNDIVLYNSVIDESILDNYRRQLRRKKDLNSLYKLINIEIEDTDGGHLQRDLLNLEISKEIEKINDKIIYLEDIMVENSKYQGEFLSFKSYFNSLIAYDDEDFADINRVHSYICSNLKIQSLLNYFEDSLIYERENKLKEKEFVYNKVGIKNIRMSLNFISANYMDSLNDEEKQLISSLYEKIDDETKVEEIYKRLKSLVNNIWKKSLTNVYSYNQSDDFCFMCTNSQFLDPRHETILISKKMLERVEDYSNYQIGFVCEFNDNILYVTENEDIMTIEHEDMSNLKTPKQIEQEFLNFKVCNRIALNGYITKISAVYFINDGDSTKYKKAVTLSNQYKLPLILLKKDKN